jgi:hypothetical protein
MGSNSAMLHRLIQLLSSKFKLCDLGAVHYFLGIEVQSTGMGLMFCQHKYILDILTRAGMTSCKLVDTQVSPLKVTILPDNSFSDPTRFCQIMGALQYLTFTRPDICFAVNRVSRFIHTPIDSYWAVVMRIIRYLKGKTSYGFHMSRSSITHMLLSYACSFPHNNIHTYIMYIFRVSISMCKCLYNSIPLYSIHVKVYCYCLTLNCYCPISNCYCLTLSCYYPISNCYCLNSNSWKSQTVTVGKVK